MSKIKFEVGVAGYGTVDSDEIFHTRVSGDVNIAEWIASQNRQFENNVYSFDPEVTMKIPVVDVVDDKDFEIELPTGCVIMFGQSGTGKSALINYIVGLAKENIIFARFNEPELPVTHFRAHELLKEVEEFINNEEGPKIMAIDSFKYFVYNSKGRSAAGRGGINTNLYSDLTQLSNAAAMVGKTLLIIINPLSTDDESKKAVMNALDGSVAGVMETLRYGRFAYKARTASNNRTRMEYRVDFDTKKDGSLKIKKSSKQRKIINDNAEAVNIVDKGSEAASVMFSRLFKALPNQNKKDN